MNKQQFLNRLAAELRKLPKEEIEAAMEYYSEYFEEAGQDQEQEVLSELGSPEQVAKQIKADYAMRWMDLEDGTAAPGEEAAGTADGRKLQGIRRGGVTAVAWVVLGIFAAPVALTFAITLGCLVFALVAVVAALALAGMACLAAFAITGGAMMILGIGGLFSSFSSALLVIGAGMVLLAVSAALFFGVGVLAQVMIRAILRWARGMIERRKSKKREKGVQRND